MKFYNTLTRKKEEFPGTGYAQFTRKTKNYIALQVVRGG